jgi:S-formylglutathione hydrolase FrmB
METPYRMYSYLLQLRELIIAQLPAAGDRIGIMGHSMGGHGALALALTVRQVLARSTVPGGGLKRPAPPASR